MVSNPESAKTDLIHKYEFKELSLPAVPFETSKLCKLFYGESAIPGKKFPFENTDDLLVVNCYFKGEKKVKQIPIEKSTFSHFDKLVMEQACKSLNPPYHDNELATIVEDPRSTTDLSERYFKSKEKNITVRCRRSLAANAKNSFFKAKTSVELLIEALIKQKEENQKKNKLKKSIEDARENEEERSA